MFLFLYMEWLSLTWWVFCSISQTSLKTFKSFLVSGGSMTWPKWFYLRNRRFWTHCFWIYNDEAKMLNLVKSAGLWKTLVLWLKRTNQKKTCFLSHRRPGDQDRLCGLCLCLPCLPHALQPHDQTWDPRSDLPRPPLPAKVERLRVQQVLKVLRRGDADQDSHLHTGGEVYK